MGNKLQKLSQNQENPQKEEEEEEDEDEDGSTFTCEICIEPISIPNMKFKNQNKCVHPFCQECIIKYITVKTQENMAQIKCPALNCEHHLEPLSCKPILSHQVFDKWSDLLCDSAILRFERCYCPNVNCSVLVVNECGGNVRKERCPKCKKLFCFHCKIGWHAGYRCEESGELRDANDVSFGELVEKQRWNRCPCCQHFVELIRGCAVVKCRCGTSFCYKCGKLVNQCRCSRPETVDGCTPFKICMVFAIFVASTTFFFGWVAITH